VGWQCVCRPTDLGGLGILNLEALSCTNMDIQAHPNVTALFSVSVISLVGNGKSTCFWTDWWLHGQNIVDLALALFALVHKPIAKKQTVQEALENHRWVGDIRGSLQDQAHLEFLLLWDTLQDIQINQGMSDYHRWTPSNSGVYSSKSAYERLFIRVVQFEPSGRIWGTWAPPRCTFFTWLASLNCCRSACCVIR
jgi:hypothetical protein